MVIWNCASNNRISLHPTYDCTNGLGKRLYAIKCSYNYIWEQSEREREWTKWKEHIGMVKRDWMRIECKRKRRTDEWNADDQTSITLTHKLSHTHKHTRMYITQDTGARDLNENRDLSIFQLHIRCSVSQMICLRAATMRRANLKLAIVSWKKYRQAINMSILWS